MERVNWTELNQTDDALSVVYRGQPFTGVAFETAPNGQLLSEAAYTNGQRFGLSRDWSPTGVLIKEVWLRADAAHGRMRTWYPSGAPKSDGQYELGICRAEKLWDSDGTLTRDFVLKPTDPQFRTLQLLS